MATALGLGDFLLDAPVELTCRELIAVAAREPSPHSTGSAG
jgi:hypothetical protein